MEKKSYQSGWYSWTAIVCMLIFFWPVGLYLLIRRISVNNVPPEKLARGLLIGGWFCIGAGFLGFPLYYIEHFTKEHLLMFSIYFPIGAVLLFLGFRKRNEANNTKRYLSMILEDHYRKLDEIAVVVGKPAERVREDLLRMIRKGSLPNAYINENTREIVLTKAKDPHLDKQMHADPMASKRPPKVVICRCCGGRNTVPGNCEYCGSPLEKQ